MDRSLTTKSAIAITNCKVQSQKGVETIFLNEKTEIQNPPKKFTIPLSHQSVVDTVDVCDLHALANNCQCFNKSG